MHIRMNLPAPQNPSGSKKPRASKPKVKSGCITCKARRVKCDEKKPACDRCSNFGRVCGGYPSAEDTPPPKDPNPPVIRKLLSKPRQGAAPSPTPSPAQAFAFSPPPPIAPFPPPLPHGVTFQDDRDYQYFCHFRDVTAFEFSSGFEPTLWTSLVLQACDDSSIRQLTTATAALSIAVKAPTSSLQDPESSFTDLHLQYALQQYGQALKGIREMVAAGQDSTRIALISALLIFCFESLHGDLGRAMTHIQSALDMIIKQLSTLAQPHYFQRIGSPGQHSNAPIDDELLMAFMRLDRPSLALISRQKGCPPLPANRIFTLLFSADQFEIPNSFATISEARIYLEDIIWRILARNHAPEAISALWDDSEAQSVYPDFESVPWQLTQWYQASDIPNTSSHLTYRLALWHDAFQPMLNYAMTPAGDSMFVPAAILHVQALAADLTITGFSTPSPLHPRTDSFSSTRSSSISDRRSSSFSVPGSSALAVPDASFFQKRLSSGRSSPAQNSESMNLFPTVQAILTFTRRMIAHPSFLRGFVFDAGIIPSLVKIVMLCPERSLRTDAIDVLKLMAPRREGMWDSRVCAEAGEKCISMESTRSGLDAIDPFLLEGM